MNRIKIKSMWNVLSLLSSKLTNDTLYKVVLLFLKESMSGNRIRYKKWLKKNNKMSIVIYVNAPSNLKSINQDSKMMTRLKETKTKEDHLL